MKRLASQLNLMCTSLAICAAIAAPPAVLAGSEILKCVDGAGHVTLTDQPCESGAQATRLVSNAAPEQYASADSAESRPLAVQRYEAPPAMHRQQAWRPQVPQRERPLAGDVATLKAARAQLLLIDAERHTRPSLATIQ